MSDTEREMCVVRWRKASEGRPENNSYVLISPPEGGGCVEAWYSEGDDGGCFEVDLYRESWDYEEADGGFEGLQWLPFPGRFANQGGAA